jgi:RTX calcium-binding nonapeptide repeat (4 copies)
MRSAVTTYIYETLPTPVVGSFGQTVGLSTLLTREFGPNYGGYTDFYLSYYGSDTLANDHFKYWTDTVGSNGSADAVTSWMQNYVPIGPTIQHQSTVAGIFNVDLSLGWDVAHVTLSNIDQFSLNIGSNIGPLAFISVPVAFDSSNNPTEFVQYSITTTDALLYNPKSNPKPSDVVNEAYDFASYYQNVQNNNDCHFIAEDVAAAIGAPLGDLAGSTIPFENQSSGFWRVVYRGGQNPGAPITNWSTRVQPGDIVRMGRNPNPDGTNGGVHTFIVLNTTPSSDGIHYLLTVYDNGATLSNGTGGIGVHYDWIPPNFNVPYYHYYDDEADPGAVTIYRLTPDHQYLIDSTALDGDPSIGARLAGTANDDHITAAEGDDTISSWTGNDVIDGGGGVNTLDYSWDNQGIVADLGAGWVWKGAGNGIDHFSHIQKFIGGSGGDKFYVGAGSFTFDGGGGFGDTLNYSSDQNLFYITVDLTQQTVSKTFFGSQTDNFSYIDTFVGTTGNDTFKGILWGAFSFDGSGGTSNTLDYSALTSGITFNIQNQSGTVEKAPDPAWKGMTDSFSNIQDFTGGAGNDTFKIAPDSRDYLLNGGDGSDTLDYSPFTQGVTFDLQQHIVGKGGWLIDQFSNMEMFKGGSGDDTLIDGSGSTKQFFDGGGANDTVVLSGNYDDYVISTSGYGPDVHTAVTPVTSTDAPLDLLNVEQLQFGDGGTMQLASHGPERLGSERSLGAHLRRRPVERLEGIPRHGADQPYTADRGIRSDSGARGQSCRLLAFLDQRCGWRCHDQVSVLGFHCRSVERTFRRQWCGAGSWSDHRGERRAAGADHVPQRLRRRRLVGARHGMEHVEGIPRQRAGRHRPCGHGLERQPEQGSERDRRIKPVHGDQPVRRPRQQICVLGHRDRRRPFRGQWGGTGDEQRDRRLGRTTVPGHVPGRVGGRHALGPCQRR